MIIIKNKVSRVINRCCAYLVLPYLGGYGAIYTTTLPTLPRNTSWWWIRFGTKHVHGLGAVHWSNRVLTGN